MSTRYRVLTSPSDDGLSTHLVDADGEPLYAGTEITVGDLLPGTHADILVAAGHLAVVDGGGG